MLQAQGIRVVAATPSAEPARVAIAKTDDEATEVERDRDDGHRAEVTSSEVGKRIQRWTGDERPVDTDEAADARDADRAAR